MTINLYSVSAFTDNGDGGNLAGVVLDCDNLTEKQKQSIASDAGYSETAFVSSKIIGSGEVDYMVSYFTPSEEVEFCGHATLAIFYLLQQLQHIEVGCYQLSAKAGVFSIRVAKNQLITVQQLLPKALACFSSQQIAPLLNLKAEDLSTPMPLEVLSTGLSDLIVPIPVGLLDSIQPNLTLIKKFCLEQNIIGLHLFELNVIDDEITANCRNFAPAVGINEESATGSACGALACYLNKHLKLQRFIFEQGKTLGCRSVLQAEVIMKNGQISCVEVGGFAQLIKVEALRLDNFKVK